MISEMELVIVLQIVVRQVIEEVSYVWRQKLFHSAMVYIGVFMYQKKCKGNEWR